MIQVLGDRVLVALPPTEAELTTPSGIVLMRDPDLARLPTRGIVVQLGGKTGQADIDDLISAVNELESRPAWPARDDAQLCCDAGPLMVNRGAVLALIESVAPAHFDVQVGDCVLFSLSAGEAFTLDDVDYVILHEAEIIGIVEPKEQAA